MISVTAYWIYVISTTKKYSIAICPYHLALQAGQERHKEEECDSHHSSDLTGSVELHMILIRAKGAPGWKKVLDLGKS